MLTSGCNQCALPAYEAARQRGCTSGDAQCNQKQYLQDDRRNPGCGVCQALT